VLRKVIIKDIVAYGTKDNDKVIVCKEIMVIQTEVEKEEEKMFNSIIKEE
jgi:hypothetical protein